jgi:hypothetical protein
MIGYLEVLDTIAFCIEVEGRLLEAFDATGFCE